MRRERFKLSLSPLAAILWPLAALSAPSRALSFALLSAVFVHELGHILALKLCGAAVRELRIELFGLDLEAENVADVTGELFCVLAGPVAGLLYAGSIYPIRADWVKRSAELSLMLSAFNLLPVPGFDGGRALLLIGAGKRLVSCLGFVSALSLMLLAHRGKSPFLLLAALCVAVRVLCPAERGDDLRRGAPGVIPAPAKRRAPPHSHPA